MLRGMLLLSLLTVAGCSSVSTWFFYPQKSLISTPADAHLDYQDVWLKTEDGTQLNAWWIPAQGAQADSNVMLLYLHGNAENISSHSHSIYWLAQAGVSVLSLDYRGFGASAGQARLPDMLQDLDAAALWMQQQHPDKELVILAQSIGTALAINFTAQAAQRHPIKALVLDAPFGAFATTARSALSKNVIGWLIWPFTALIPNQWDANQHIDKIDLPVLMMHSPKDTVIPYSHGKKLYTDWQQAHPEQQLCWLDSKGPHIMSFAFPELRKATLDFMINQTCQTNNALH